MEISTRQRDLLCFLSYYPADVGDDKADLWTRKAACILHYRNPRDQTEKQEGQVSLVRVLNPWGRKSASGGGGNWDGPPWTDTSQEWNEYWFKKLKPRFRNDGTFLISFEHMLDHFLALEQTRIFEDPKWCVRQRWTQLPVPWTAGYNATTFKVLIKKKGEVFFALSQADTRYFRGLEGRYTFHLGFLVRLHEGRAGSDVRFTSAPRRYPGSRSVSASAVLKPGTYEVLVKIEAQYRIEVPTNLSVFSTEDAIMLETTKRPEKVQKVAKNLQWVLDRVMAEGECNPSQDDAEEAIREGDGGTAAVSADVRNTAQHAGGGSVRTGGHQANSATQYTCRERFDQQQKQWEVDMQRQRFRPIADPSRAPWNALCVAGLSVYSQDPDLEIEVKTPSKLGRDKGNADSGQPEEQ